MRTAAMGDPAEQAARDVVRMLAGLPGLRRLVDAAADLVDAPLTRWPEGPTPVRRSARQWGLDEIEAGATEPPHAGGTSHYGRGADWQNGPGRTSPYGR